MSIYATKQSKLSLQKFLLLFNGAQRYKEIEIE